MTMWAWREYGRPKGGCPKDLIAGRSPAYSLADPKDRNVLRKNSRRELFLSRSDLLASEAGSFAQQKMSEGLPIAKRLLISQNGTTADWKEALFEKKMSRSDCQSRQRLLCMPNGTTADRIEAWGTKAEMREAILGAFSHIRLEPARVFLVRKSDLRRPTETCFWRLDFSIKSFTLQARNWTNMRHEYEWNEGLI